MARAYPVHLCLAGRTAVVVGAGRVAQRRIARLREAGAELRVVAPEATDEVRTLAEQGALRWAARPFEEADCSGAALVFAATAEPEVNARVERAARAAGAWVNRADAPERCDFWVPAQATSEACTASLSTEGRAPSAARRLARELSRWLRSGPDRFVQAVEQARLELERTGAADRAARLRELSEGPLFEACRQGDEPAIQRLVDATTATGGARG